MPRGPSTPSSTNGIGYTQDQLILPGGPPTPSSMHSSGRSASPATISSGRKSPYRMPPRSATAPLLPRSPSPDLPLPQECAFPVFPTPPSRSATPTTPKRIPVERARTEPVPLQLQPDTTATEGKQGISADMGNRAGKGGWEVDQYGHAFPENFRSFSRPASPARSVAGSRRPSNSSVDSRRKFSFSNPRPAPEDLVPSEPIPPLPQQIEQERPQLPLSLIAGGSRRPSTQSSDINLASAPISLPTKATLQSHMRKPSISAAHRPLDEIGSVKTHRPTLSRGQSPATSEANINDNTKSFTSSGLRTDIRLHDAPPVPEPAESMREGWNHTREGNAVEADGRNAIGDPFPLPQQAQFDYVEALSNASHTPSESTSSNGSEDSMKDTSSSRSSPPTSSISSSPEAHFAGLERVLQAIPPTAAPPPPINTSAPEPRRRAPAKSFSRPTYAAAAAVNPSPPPRPPPAPADAQESKPPSQPESPMDPALKGSRLPPILTDDKHFPPVSSRQPQYPQSAVTPTCRGLNNFEDFAPPPLNFQKPPARRATTGHKGKCRGCTEVITGKSVSSADGRLTGRWHKQCFVCKTCKEPFPTMDFYVLGNDPYCGRHYHELNKSLCSKCDRGIEGQYVETEREKFHPHCFNCQECHLILRDNYFELNGKIYCEQHAFKTSHLAVGPARRFPERRTTRLMMMM